MQCDALEASGVGFVYASGRRMSVISGNTLRSIPGLERIVLLYQTHSANEEKIIMAIMENEAGVAQW
jgi:hypothetical protein